MTSKSLAEMGPFLLRGASRPIRIAEEHLIFRAAPTRACVRCVMDDTDPEILFDDAGVCSHCRGQQQRLAQEIPPRPERDREFSRVLERLRQGGKGKPYDCVIGLSGGVDSSMVAYILRDAGIRPLAVHLDNGWDAEVSVRNIKELVKRLDIDLHTHVLNWDEFRDLQLAFIRSGVINLEVPTDHAITAILYRMASKFGIRYIVSGSNLATEAIMPRSWGYDNKDWRHIRAVHRRFGTKGLSSYPRLRLWDWAYYTFVAQIKFVPILNLVDYDRQQAVGLLQREMGWRDYGPKHGESIFTRVFQCAILPSKLGIDKRKAHLSSMIGSGQISRAEAVSLLQEPLYPDGLLGIDMPFFLKKLGLSQEEYERMLERPAVSHRAFPNNEWWFKRLSSLTTYAKSFAKRV